MCMDEGFIWEITCEIPKLSTYKSIDIFERIV